MATVHKGFRLDTELVGRVDAWAEEHGTTEAEAVRRLLDVALRGEEEPEEEPEEPRPTADAELRRLYGDHIRDLRASVATLTAQVAEKDRQLARVLDIADHAQVLQAAHARGQITDGGDVQQGVQRPGLWERIRQKVRGQGQ